MPIPSSSPAPGLSAIQASNVFNPILPRRRIIGWMNSYSNGMTSYTSNGTTDLNGTAKLPMVPFTTCTHAQWLWWWGSTIGATGLFTPIGNSGTLKAGLQDNGNYLPLSFNGALQTSLITPIITGFNTNTTTAAVSSQTVVVANSSNIPIGSIIQDVTNGASGFVQANNTTTNTLTIYPATSMASGDVISVISYPGQSVVIGDMQSVISNPMDIVLPGGVTYFVVNFVQVQPGQKYPFTSYAGTYTSFLGTTGYKGSSIVYAGSPSQNGGDYTWIGNPTLGSISGTGYVFGPTVGICTQIIPKAVVLIVGDSISWGYANNIGGGYIGTAINAASGSFFNAGISGVTSQNMSRFAYFQNWLSGYADHVICHVNINDLPGGVTVPVVQSSNIALATSFTARGATFTFCTTFPRVTSSDSMTTLAGQTPIATESGRVQLNNWLRDTSANGFVTQALATCRPGSIVYKTIDSGATIESNINASLISLNQTTYIFTTAATASVAYTSTYIDGNGNTFTMGPTASGATSFVMTSPSASNVATSGTLTLSTGTGTASIPYISRTQSSANQQGYGTGGHWPLSNGGTTGGTANWASADGIHPSLNVNTATAAAIPTATYAALNNYVFGY